MPFLPHINVAHAITGVHALELLESMTRAKDAQNSGARLEHLQDAYDGALTILQAIERARTKEMEALTPEQAAARVSEAISQGNTPAADDVVRVLAPRTKS
jgi:hypothetical protein